MSEEAVQVHPTPTSRRFVSGDPNGPWDSPDIAGEGISQDHILERQRWLVHLRWFAIGAVFLVVLLTRAQGWVTETPKLFATVLLMAVYNAFFHLRVLGGSSTTEPNGSGTTLFLQILCDLAALTLLLHWSGGIENPFAIFFVFHMAIGAMLLSRRATLALGIAATVLFGVTLVLEHIGVLPHHSLLFQRGGGVDVRTAIGPFGLLPLLVAYLVAFVTMLFGVAYFVQSVESRRRRAEFHVHQRERVELARERMARVGAISAGVAHTVRNPLHGVINCMDLLRHEIPEESSNADEIFELMSEGLDRIERVTKRLLDLTQERPIRFVATDVKELVEESLKFVSTRRKDRNITIDVNVETAPLVDVDPDRMCEVLINLLDNAFTACDEGGRVTVLAGIEPDREGTAYIEVSDSGKGITADSIECIFDPFYTTKVMGEGSGLGLSIVRRAVEEHEGELTVTSIPGEGASFRILLPLHSAERSIARVEV